MSERHTRLDADQRLMRIWQLGSVTYDASRDQRWLAAIDRTKHPLQQLERR